MVTHTINIVPLFRNGTMALSEPFTLFLLPDFL